MTPLKTNARPANTNDDTYDFEISYNRPASGGPIKTAIPRNMVNIPNEFVILSSPSKSTSIKDVIETKPPLEVFK